MAPQPSYVRVSYVIPPPAQTPPQLSLPPLGVDRNGAIRPLLIPASPSTPTTQTAQAGYGHSRAQTHPRHRLGVSSLALDSSTQLSGKNCAEGILYTGGRDGQIIAWDLGLKTKQRRVRYGYNDHGFRRRKGRWENLTGWGDYMEEEDESDEEVMGSDGDVLGDVVNSGEKKRRASEVQRGTVPYEEAWELDTDAAVPPPSAFRQCIQTHTDWVNDVLLCNLNQTVVSASSDGSVRAWSPHLSNSLDPVLIGVHEDYARCLATSPHQSWVASGSFDRTIKLWDLSRTVSPLTTNFSISSSNTPTPLSTLSLPTPSQKASIYAIAIDQFGSLIASGSPERVVRMWDPRSGKRTGKLVGHTDNIRAIVMSSDGRYLLTGSADASIKLWSLTTQRCLHTFAHHTDSVWALASQHPSLELFYSGDRAGVVSRVDMEGCNTIDEGECLVVCNATRSLEAENQDSRASVLGDIFRLQDGTGVNKIVTMDDRLVWTATGSSSIKRWKAPPQRALRMAFHTTHSATFSPSLGSGFTSNSRRTSASSGVHTPRRGFSMGDSPNGLSDDVTPPWSSPTTISSRPGLNPSTATNHGMSIDQDDTMLFGIPYQSLVRLVSPHEPYSLASPLSAGGFGSSRGQRDAEVATLYSAASVKSVPLPVARSSHPPLVGVVPNAAIRSTFRQSTGNTLSPRFAVSPDGSGPEASWTPSPRAEYEGRDLAATATPLELFPDDIIQGEHGLVRSLILNDRMHALTINTAGCVAVWDIARCRCVGWYDRSDVLAEMGCTNGTDRSTESDNDFRSPRELLETVRERIEGESVIAPWSTVDTRTGCLTIHLSERCFDTEIYADEAGYGSERYYDTEQRLNVGKWVLSNLFDSFVREELKLLRRVPLNIFSHLPSPSTPQTTGAHRSESAGHIEPQLLTSELGSPMRSFQMLSIPSNESNTSRSAVSTVVTSPIMTPAILPDMALIDHRRTSVALVPPLIPIVSIQDTPLSPNYTPSATIGSPTPRPRAQQIETPSVARSAPTKEGDYFSLKTNRRLSATATTPDDFSGWGGPGSKEKEPGILQTPLTPSGGGFMGRLRQLGKISKRPLSEDLMTPGGSVLRRSNEGQPDALKADEGSESEPETDQSRFLASLMSQTFHPPTAADAPPLSLPPDTEIVLAEEIQSGWSNIYRGTVAGASQDTHMLDKVMPLWLMQYLLTNKIPIVPNIKVSFGVAAWIGKPSSGDLEADVAVPSRLTANRYLRVRKILGYVQDKIDVNSSRSISRSGSIFAATPRSSVDSSGAVRVGSAPSQSNMQYKTDVEKPRPEDAYELLCNDIVLPLNMTLASIRHYVWRSSAELLLFYRKKA
ncbi:WD40 repeat-like protein [Ramaria rubella]|nr:WD40 repeat-like protein [Ramaria rubella]